MWMCFFSSVRTRVLRQALVSYLYQQMDSRLVKKKLIIFCGCQFACCSYIGEIIQHLINALYLFIFYLLHKILKSMSGDDIFINYNLDFQIRKGEK
jgi:hypothetical protein